MATNSERTNKRMKLDHNTPEITHLIYILSHKIQKQHLSLLKDKALSKNLNVTDEFSLQVTHIITGFCYREDALRYLDFDDDLWCEDVHIVQTNWLSACIKAGKVIEVNKEFVLPKTPEQKTESDDDEDHPPRYECQRATPLKHHNHRFSDALDILASKAELKDDDANYIRALAFRRASCCLKSLPAPLQTVTQLRGMRYMGHHSKQVVKDVLENGFSSEAADIENSDWYQAMMKFTDIYGVGKKIGELWYDRGHRTMEDVMNDEDLPRRNDDRIVMGLAFYKDLTLPVLRVEAQYMFDLVKRIVDRLLPGCRVVLTGGFRRGKEQGHDIDILLSHPEEGREHGLLPDLLHELHRLGLAVFGSRTHSTFREDTLRNDNAGKYLRSSLDHFEKWMGILKIDKHIRDGTTASGDLAEGVTGNSHSDTAEGGQMNSSGHIAQDNKGNSSKGVTKSDQQTISCTSTIKGAAEEAREERCWYARRVDLIIAPASQYYYALVGWTGSKQFNRSLRYYADKELRMKLTSHGLYDHQQRRSLPATSEKEVFKHLKVEHRDPTLRNC